MKKTPEFYAPLAIFCVLTALLLSCGGCQIWRRISVSSGPTLASRQYVRQAVESLDHGNEEEACQRLTQALKLNPENTEARAMYADILWDAGDRQSAIQELQKVAGSAEAAAAVYVKLARMYYESGDRTLSRKYLEDAFRRDGTRSDAWMLRGQLYAAEKRRTEAVTAFHQAIFHDPENCAAYVLLADEYIMAKKPQRALETAQYARHKFPPDQEPAEVLFREGVAMYHLGRFSEAVESLSLAGKRSPRDVHILSALAEAQYLAGKPAEARQTAVQGLAVIPNHQRCQQIIQKIDQDGGMMNVHPQVGRNTEAEMEFR